MSAWTDRLALRIKSFVENPVTNLVKGIALTAIGISEIARTFRDDINHGHLRVGHGLVIIGLFSILGALPQLIEGVAAGGRYLELHKRKGQADKP